MFLLQYSVYETLILPVSNAAFYTAQCGLGLHAGPCSKVVDPLMMIRSSAWGVIIVIMCHLCPWQTVTHHLHAHESFPQFNIWLYLCLYVKKATSWRDRDPCHFQNLQIGHTLTRRTEAQLQTCVKSARRFVFAPSHRETQHLKNKLIGKLIALWKCGIIKLKLPDPPLRPRRSPSSSSNF